MDVAGRFFAGLLAVIVIFLAPLQYIAQAQSEIIDEAVGVYAAEFADTARHEGKITLDAYENLIHQIDQTGELYDIELEISHPVSGKEIAKKTLGDEMPELITEITSLKNTKSMLVENSIMEKTEGTIFSLATHTHIDACYNGTLHTCSEYGGSCYTESSNNYDCNGCQTSTSYCSGCDYHTTYCSGCKKEYYGWISCPCAATSHAGYTSNKKTTVCGCMDGAPYGWWTGYNWVCSGHSTLYCPGHSTLYCPGHTGYSYTKTCDKISGANYNGSTRVYETCNQVVTSIAVLNSYQTVDLGQPIDTTVIATFLDGHTGGVSCSNNYNANVVGQQTVTFTYSGLVGNAKTTDTSTCTTQVTVIDPTILTGITITPVTQSVYRYQSPLFTVTAAYSNGTNKAVLGFTTSGYNSSLLGTQIVTISYSEGSITKSATATVIVNRISITCPVCGNIYSLDAQDMDSGCPVCKGRITKIIATPNNMTLLKGNTLPITVEAIYADGHKYTVLGWTSNYDSNALGIQQVTISYLGFSTIITVEVVSKMKTCSICSRDYALSEDNTDAGCPLCKKELISINVTEESVSIEKHHPLSINVIGTFRDGHTQIITDWSSNLVADTTGTYDVTVLYQNATDHVIVTVLDEGHIQCAICGLEYVFSDSPSGCPVCSVTVIGIEAALRNGGTTVMYKSQPNLQIVLRYRDTHRQITYTGWTISGYQPDLIGLQTITVHYGVFSTTLDIEIVDELPGVICPNGHEYYINQDGSDPGCPYCVQDAEKENAIFLFENTYTSEILTILYDDSIFVLNEGDYLTVTLTQKDVSVRAKLKNMFFGTNKGIANKKFTFGGEVI